MLQLLDSSFKQGQLDVGWVPDLEASMALQLGPDHEEMLAKALLIHVNS